jgi:hypothetical protein
MRMYLEIAVLLALVFLLNACGATKVNYTLYLRETNYSLYDLKGNECLISGYQLDSNGTRLITFYKNCDIHAQRALEQFELKQWLEPKDKK